MVMHRSWLHWNSPHQNLNCILRVNAKLRGKVQAALTAQASEAPEDTQEGGVQGEEAEQGDGDKKDASSPT